ncbi:MAG TPA: flagellar hook-associated protein FlgL [Rhodanobacteraceae bacterium]|nr:flagellar hook-associated protein FlgL [Rhodanobacteraceae bacterium]
MRISTQTLFTQSMRAMNQQQAGLLHVGQQIASGRRVLTPSDDPNAASLAVQVGQAQAITGQYTASRVSARNSLAMETSVLGSVTNAVTSAKTLIIQAASGTLTDVDRASIASQLEGIYDTLVGQANATDGNGRYLFGGYQDGTTPFVTDPATGGVTYVGDTEVRQERIDASRLMPVADNGQNVFQGAQGTTGFMAVADPANAGSVTLNGTPSVANQADPDFGHGFTIAFAVDPATGDATYTITDQATGAAGPAQAYTAGQPIQYAGLALSPTGTPADGDSIDVDQARNLNTDVFKTIEKALAVLKTPADTDAKRAALQNTLGNVMTELDNSLNNVSMVQASVGSRLNELDVVDSVAANRQINYAQTKSDLVDLDYTTAISDYTLRQVGLQAAQKTFMSMTQMNLFNLM